MWRNMNHFSQCSFKLICLLHLMSVFEPFINVQFAQFSMFCYRILIWTPSGHLQHLVSDCSWKRIIFSRIKEDLAQHWRQTNCICCSRCGSKLQKLSAENENCYWPKLSLMKTWKWWLILGQLLLSILYVLTWEGKDLLPLVLLRWSWFYHLCLLSCWRPFFCVFLDK